MLRMLKSAGARTALQQLAITVKEASSPVDWSLIPDSRLPHEIDANLRRIQAHMNNMEAYGHTLKPEAMGRRQLELMQMVDLLNAGHTEHVARMDAAYMHPYAAMGVNPPTYRPPSRLHRMSLGFLGDAGEPGPPAAHRTADVQAALDRAHRLAGSYAATQPHTPAPSQPSFGRGLGRLALGAGALVGGGYLLKNLMSRDEPEQARFSPYPQLPAGY